MNNAKLTTYLMIFRYSLFKFPFVKNL